MPGSSKKGSRSSPPRCEKMPENRFFASSIPKVGFELFLEGAELRHLLVMRPRIGDKFEFIDGKGHLAKGELVKISKEVAQIEIKAVQKALEEPFELILAQALPKTNRLDLILEKGTELGMTSLWLFSGEESEKKTLSAQQNERIEHVVIAAIKQCGRLYKPKVSFLPPIPKWKPFTSSAYFGDLSEEAPLFYKAWSAKGPHQELIFVNGPEKGFSEEERLLLKNLGAEGVSLGPHILRTDTAAIAALALMGHFESIIQKNLTPS